MIDIKTLISDINLKMDEEFIIQLDGIITTKIKTNGLKLQEEKKCIKFFDKNNNEILSILKYQIIKIENVSNGYVIKFDAMQNLKIEV